MMILPATTRASSDCSPGLGGPFSPCVPAACAHAAWPAAAEALETPTWPHLVWEASRPWSAPESVRYDSEQSPQSGCQA